MNIFSRDPITEKEKNEIFDLFVSQIKNNNDVLFLINFLQKLNNLLDGKGKNDLKDYLSNIISDVSLFNLSLKYNSIREDIDI